MLHLNAVEPGTLSLLNKLQKIPELNSFYLVGGTALALKFGHRISIDIDLFGKGLEKEKVIAKLNHEFGKKFEYESTPDKWALFCYINKIKVDIINYNKPIINSIESADNIRMLSTLDIAAMKINAILGRGNKKDFWDINEILNHYSLEEVIEAHRKKFSSQLLLISIPQALTYFDDAESTPDPVCLKGLKWANIKRAISQKVNRYLS